MLMLASASPARRRLLEQAGVQHQVRVSGVDEDQIQHADPVELVKLLAQA
ncbi:MAG: Maf family protein, partial [Synechococcus sp.]|nr:Maf family protein [Synechococcus sp.]